MRKIWFALLILSVITIGLLHTFTPGHNHLYHDTYRRLSYFPITIGAILFGVRGGLLLAGLTSIAFIPHLLIFIGKAPETYISELTEIVLYLLAGAVVGIIAEKEKKLREKYKLISEKLEKSYARLHEETSLLIDVEEQLRTSQKTAAIGKLTASLVHEIKNPLASIRGAAEIVLDDYPHGNEKRKFPEIILAETGRLNTTVNEMLSFAKQPKNGKEVMWQPISKVLDHIMLLLEPGLSKKGIELTIHVDDDAREFPVDGDKMSQVFLNIILNAEDAIGKNGVVGLTAVKKEKSLLITIEDDGPGISPDNRDRIFSPFYSGKEGGTGLGLSISRKIVESYRGTLGLAQADTGAKFIVELPEKGIGPDYYETLNGSEEGAG